MHSEQLHANHVSKEINTNCCVHHPIYNTCAGSQLDTTASSRKTLVLA
uniref:Uncharacterized protein n=1 Tax=Arundo donax TaxID=35708 RepID=A0A0A9G9L5_ARUDO